jgi:hypothetical protein
MSYFFLLILGFFSYIMIIDFNLKYMDLGYVKINV